MTRREIMLGLSGMMLAGSSGSPGSKSPFQTRGLVLTPEDLTLEDWPKMAGSAGLTTIALHPFPKPVTEFVASEKGNSFLSACKKLGLQVEYELHSMSDLLPRDLFAQHPDYFRMDETGSRSPLNNLCISSRPALDTTARNAVKIAKELTPTTNRYFFWGDDGAPWCRCPSCHSLSDSDQALVLENYVIKVLRNQFPRAKLAHLAYANTLKPPERIKPDPGIFLEFAPINRRYDVSIGHAANGEHLEAMDANLKVFGAKDAQVLEYWLDVSRFSKWTKPAVKLPWNPKVVAEDLKVYASREVQHITSFAVYIDRDYVRRYGEPPTAEYGRLLRDFGVR